MHSLPADWKERWFSLAEAEGMSRRITLPVIDDLLALTEWMTTPEKTVPYHLVQYVLRGYADGCGSWRYRYEEVR